jgi:hypothetical protein
MKHWPLILCLVPLPVAADVSLVVHGLSWHFGAKGYNETNPGLGLRVEDKNWVYNAGWYKNSVSEASVYVGAGRSLVSWGRWQINAHAGFVSGYAGTIVPFVIPEVVWGTKHIKVAVVYAPRVQTGEIVSEHVLGVSLIVPLKP